MVSSCTRARVASRVFPQRRRADKTSSVCATGRVQEAASCCCDSGVAPRQASFATGAQAPSVPTGSGTFPLTPLRVFAPPPLPFRRTDSDPETLPPPQPSRRTFRHGFSAAVSAGRLRRAVRRSDVDVAGATREAGLGGGGAGGRVAAVRFSAARTGLLWTGPKPLSHVFIIASIIASSCWASLGPPAPADAHRQWSSPD